MQNELYIPGKRHTGLNQLYIHNGEDNRVSELIDLAKILQYGMEAEEWSSRSTMVDQAIQMLGNTEGLNSDRSMMLHANVGVVLGEDPETSEPQEVAVGDVHVKGKFDGITHLEIYGDFTVYSLCLSLGNVEIIRSKSAGALKPGLQLPKSSRFVIPVLHIESHFAA